MVGFTAPEVRSQLWSRRGSLNRLEAPIPLMGSGETNLITASPLTVGRLKSGALSVVMEIALPPPALLRGWERGSQFPGGFELPSESVGAEPYRAVSQPFSGGGSRGNPHLAQYRLAGGFSNWQLQQWESGGLSIGLSQYPGCPVEG